MGMFLAPQGWLTMTPGVAEHIEDERAAVTSVTTAPDTDDPIAVPALEGHVAPVASVAPVAGLTARAAAVWKGAMEYCVPAGLERESEGWRRGRLIAGFGIVGFILGGLYAGIMNGHTGEASIIGAGSLGLACAPFLLRFSRSTRVAGNFVVLVLLLGFCGLCGMEGGIRSHAVGWVAVVPLCALLLVDGPEAAGWCALSVVVTSCFAILDIQGVRLPVPDAASWHQIATGAGYVGLSVFVSVLGFILESGRRSAQTGMERALAGVEEANERFKKLDAEKNEFLRVVAHDLKNPLNVAVGFAELIVMGRNESRERDQDDARFIIEAADRMITLINQFVEVNAIEQGQFPLDPSICDLGLISRQVAASLSAAAEKKHISIYTAGPSEPIHVFANPKGVSRILENLLSNAIKFSPPGRDVFIRKRDCPDGAVWEVQDQGPGLNEADQARLFRKFTKLSARPTGGETSTGLGLAIVKLLAEAMNGAVDCKSTAGEGATFSVRLPGSGGKSSLS